MSFSPAARWLIAALIPLTLGWKLAATQSAPLGTKDKVIGFLTRQDPRLVIAEQRSVNDMPLIHATAGDCSILAIEAAPDGWDRDIIRNLAKTSDELFIVFRGEIYDEQPRWLTVTDHLWWGMLRKAGIASRDMPPIAVAATRACNARRLPWRELGA